ncbi:hypothetical protein ACFWXI_06570 [[Kitasatospora] papulosa]|uniref:hypothetical protein n=1 Tax=[Kitasatospora] papulosa TaxID=1464011 RepID=UPI0036B2D9FE
MPKKFLSVVATAGPALKKLRPTAMTTAGFTLISAGSWSIYGQGVGLITGGILTVVLQWWVDSD